MSDLPLTSRFEDDHFPAYTIGGAANLLDVRPAFLRSLDATGLLSPQRSPGGQRRYSRAELTVAARVRELLDENMPLAAATRIVTLERQLRQARARIADLERAAGLTPTDEAGETAAPADAPDSAAGRSRESRSGRRTGGRRADGGAAGSG